MRLLVVEDEADLAHALAKGLRRQGYAVDLVFDGMQGLELAEVNDYDLLILDLNLPEMDGLEVCRSLRAGQHSGEVSRKRVVCHAAEQHDLQRVIQRAIQLLPSRYRPVVYLRYAEDMTFEAIGHQLSIPESTAKTYFQRARPLLRASLDLYHPYHTRSRQAERVW